MPALHLQVQDGGHALSRPGARPEAPRIGGTLVGADQVEGRARFRHQDAGGPTGSIDADPTLPLQID